MLGNCLFTFLLIYHQFVNIYLHVFSSLSIPDCVDRAVYCVNPPKEIVGGSITVLENPEDSHYQKPGACSWTRWFNSNDNVGGKGDLEIISEINDKFGTMACGPYPMAQNIKVRTVDTKQEVTKEGGPEKYEQFDKYNGFTCLNQQQVGHYVLY